MTQEKNWRSLLYNEETERFTFYMPNEVFDDLQNNIKSSSHIAFSYCYIYLTFWLWRNTKYFKSDIIIDNKHIKELLGYNPKTQGLDYLIKKDGLLDKIEYTESTKDYPLSWYFEKESGFDFFMSSDVSEEDLKYLPVLPKRFFLKKPLKGYYRVIKENEEEIEISGTFQEIKNTHIIDFNVFLYCISNKELGCTGFYLYSYILHRENLASINDKSFDISLKNLSKNSEISERSLDKYLNLLKGYQMIDFTHNQDNFVLGLPDSERRPNSYFTRAYKDFNFKSNPVEFEKINIMKRSEYLEKLKESQKEQSNKINIDENTLPF